MRALPYLALACLALACLALSACAGESYRNGIYEDDQVRYRAAAPAPQWRRVEVEENDLAFHRKGLGTISVNSTCIHYEDVPAIALVNHLLFDTNARQFITEETVTLDGRGAHHVVARVELDGVPIELEVFLLKKDGCVFDLTHIRARNAPPEARAEFMRFVERFAVLEVHRNG